MMMSDLPLALVEEILSRVPATSLKRLRSTCKLWNGFFKEPRFTEKHFGNAPKQSHVLMLKDSRVCSMSVNLNVAPPTIEFKGELDLKDSHSSSQQVDIAQVFHCDGLLLCTTDDNKPVVYNPCSGETRWIQLETACKIEYSRFALGYQNNKCGRSYKILRIWDRDGQSQLVAGSSKIYEFSSDSWKKVLDVDAVNCYIRRYGYGVSLKGNTYWLALSDMDVFLLSFDFTRERHVRLCLPPSLNEAYWMALSVIGEERLSVSNRSFGPSKIEIWVTNQIDADAALSWSKSFAVDLEIPVYVSDNLMYKYLFWILLFDEEKKVALCCNVRKETSKNLVYKVYVTGEDDKYYTETPYLESTNIPECWPCIFNYFPSLVQIPQGRGQKEKTEIR